MTVESKFLKEIKKGGDPRDVHFNILQGYPHRLAKNQVFKPLSETDYQPLYKQVKLTIFYLINVLTHTSMGPTNYLLPCRTKTRGARPAFSDAERMKRLRAEATNISLSKEVKFQKHSQASSRKGKSSAKRDHESSGGYSNIITIMVQETIMPVLH